MVERHFGSWDYAAVQETERIAGGLPVMSRERAMAYFLEVYKAVGESGEPVERPLGQVLAGLSGAFDNEFDVAWDTESDDQSWGVLLLENHDMGINTVLCVARVSEASFLTRAFTFFGDDEIRALKVLQSQGPSETQR